MSGYLDPNSLCLKISPEALTPAGLPGSFLLDQALAAELLPARPLDSNKGTYGRVGLWAGSDLYPGALLLATEAALRSGVGYVEVASSPQALQLCLLKFPEIVLLRGEQAQGKDLDPRLNTLALGPGWSLHKEHERVLFNLWSGQRSLILDADALNLLAQHTSGPDLRRKLSLRLPGTTLLTPHPGEFARLAPDLAALDSEGQRLSAARRFAQESGALLLLKGSHSILALPDGRCFISKQACSGLARAGSGDVLTGLCLGLAGQGLSLAEAALLAIWLHVKTAQLLATATSERSMRVGDLAPNFWRAFKLLDPSV